MYDLEPECETMFHQASIINNDVNSFVVPKVISLLFVKHIFSEGSNHLVAKCILERSYF
jgi:hypothetical protein